VKTSSIVDKKAVNKIGIYSTTKAAVMTLTRTAAREYAQSNIRVNAISPGLVMTDMATRMSLENPEYFNTNMLDVIPMGRGGEPDEIAKIVTRLCEKASFITGACITADGGWSA